MQAVAYDVWLVLVIASGPSVVSIHPFPPDTSCCSEAATQRHLTAARYPTLRQWFQQLIRFQLIITLWRRHQFLLTQVWFRFLQVVGSTIQTLPRQFDQSLLQGPQRMCTLMFRCCISWHHSPGQRFALQCHFGRCLLCFHCIHLGLSILLFRHLVPPSFLQIMLNHPVLQCLRIQLEHQLRGLQSNQSIARLV